MKVLLVYPDSRKELIGWGDLGAIAEPLALEYLAAGARADGHDVRILDLRLHKGRFRDTLEEFEPDVVGLTGYSMHALRILALCREAKAVLPGCRTVVGGHHATLLAEDFFVPEVDCVVQGEGVARMKVLLASWSRDEQTVPGAVARPEGGICIADRPGGFDMDELPLPERGLVAGDRESYFIDWMKPIAMARTTVGCPYRCSFCSLWRIMDGRYHVRECERVADELETVREECVFLVDDEPFVNGPRMAQLAGILEARAIRKRYFAYCRIDTFLRQPELMARWRAIGLERLFFGIEGVTAAELKDYNKRLELAQVEEALARAREMGIEVFAQFIVSPSYTRKDFKTLVRFIEHNRVAYPSFTILTPLPGTDALVNFDAVVERQPNGRPNWELYDLQHPVTTTALPRDEFMREYRNLQRIFSGCYTQYRNLPVQPRAPTVAAC